MCVIKVIKEGMQAISKQITNNNAHFLFTCIASMFRYLSKNAKQHIKMLLIHQATFLHFFLFECFIITQLYNFAAKAHVFSHIYLSQIQLALTSSKP